MRNDKKNQTANASEISTPVSFLLRNRQVVMFLGLSLLVFGWPFIHNVDVVDRFFELIIFIVFLAAVPALYVSRAWTGMLVAFAVLAIGTSWLSGGRLSGLGLISSLASIAFYGLVMVHEVHVVFFESRRVTWDTILGAINGYLLIGIVFMFAYDAIYQIHPGSFEGIGHVFGDADLRTSSFLYFSYVTLASLGYGDISPKAPEAAAFAYAEVIIGQFYMVIMVARLVSLQIVQSQANRQ